MADPPPPRRRRWWRWAAAGLGLVALLPLLAIAAGLLALRAAGVRQGLLARATAEIERRLAIHVTARDFDLRPGGGALELREVEVGAPGAAPFLTVRRLVIEIEPASLRRDVIVVRSVVVDTPRIDLAAPLPPAGGGRPASGQPARRVDVLAFSITDGAVVHGVAPASAGTWLSGWQAGAITARGSFLAGRAEMSLQAGAIELDRPEQPPLQARLSATATAGADGSVEATSLAITGDGIEAAVSGSGALGPPVSFVARFTAAVEPARVAPALHTGGRLAAEGQVAWPELTGHASLVAQGVAVEAARAWVDGALLDRLGAAGTTADARADVFLSGASLDATMATAEITWQGRDRPLAHARASLTPTTAVAPAEPGISLEVALLPTSPGRREASLRLPPLPAGGTISLDRIESASLRLELPDVGVAYAEARALWPGLVPAADPAWPLIGSLAATVEARGSLAAPTATAAAEWRPEAGSSVRLTAAGLPRAGRGRVTLGLDHLRLDVLRPGLTGTVSGAADASGSTTDYRVVASLDGTGIGSTEGPRLDRLHLEADSDGRELHLAALDAESGERRLSASGRTTLRLPLADADLAFRLQAPAPGVTAATGTLALHDGVLSVDLAGADTVAGPVAATASLPLGTLSRVPELAGALAGLPLTRGDGPLHLAVEAPELDTCTLLPALGLTDRPERVRAAVQVDLWLDPADPTAATGTLVLAGLTLDSGGQQVRAEGPLRLDVANRVATLAPVELRAGEVPLAIRGSATLAERFDPRVDAPAALVRSFSFAATGAVPATLLEPFLVGGAAGGTLHLDVEAGGTPADPRATLRVSGEDATFFWPTPYATRVERPELEATYEHGQATLRSGRLLLNRGQVDLAGTRAADGEIIGQVLLDGISYRLDYGLRATLAGELDLHVAPGGRPLLSGRVSVERGVLDRDIDLERELLPRFLAPVVSPGSETNFLDTIDLDLSLDSGEGVRVKNNLADLRATWDRISITGTVWNPIIRGAIEVDPGGLVLAYGQRIRLDRAVATFTGNRATDPRLELSTTSSLEDPSIGRGALAAGLAGGSAAGGGLEALAGGVAGYFGERLTSRLGASFGLTVRPLLVFGETDPSARLTLTRDLSSNVAFAVSLDLRNAQRQTYLLDLHGFRRLPQLTAQAFTKDGEIEGGTLQQVLQLGGGHRRRAEEVLLGTIRIDAPAGVPRRALRRAVGLTGGDPLPAAAAFDAEVELGVWLREHGWPDAVVTVVTADSSRRRGRRDLLVRIEPGPRVEFRFAGDPPPRAARPAITALYRTGAYESESLAEMKAASVRALRSLGYLDPEVEVGVDRRARSAAGPDRAVTVHARGGRRAALERVRFEGVPDDVAELLDRRFAPPLERTELAAGLPDADRRVAESLRVLAFPAGRVVGRELSEDGKALTVRLEPGPRTLLRHVELAVEGGGPPEAPLPVLPLAAGDPARLDRVGLAAATLEDAYHARGFADVRVRSELSPAGDGADLRLVIATGLSYHLTGVDLEGARHTRRGFALRLAGLTAGDPLDAAAVSRARAHLLATGLFSAVAARTQFRADQGAARVSFAVTEKPPYTLAYGLRWDSDTGLSGVVDLLDANLLGRGLTAGARLVSRASTRKASDRSARVYLAAPRVAGRGSTLELFAERRRMVAGGLVTDAAEETVQLSRTLGRSVTARLYGRYNDTHITEVSPDPFFPLDLRIKHPFAGVQLILDRRDDPVAATRGLFASLDVSGSGPFLASDFKYVRGYAQVNSFVPVRRHGGAPLTWAQSVRVGLARAFDQDLLFDVRFYAGGEYSVRGYPREGLGPLEVLGSEARPAGGAALLVVNEELRFPLPLDLTGLVFVDAGQVWETTSELGGGLAKAFGLGLRASTPVGVLRLDAARPLDRRPGDPAYRLYLGFGNAF